MKFVVLMKILKLIILITLIPLATGCLSTAEWQKKFEEKVQSLAKICGKYRRVAANDEARVGMSEECLMQTKYQYSQINTVVTWNNTKKKFVYLSIQGTFIKTEYVYVVDGIVKSVSKS